MIRKFLKLFFFFTFLILASVISLSINAPEAKAQTCNGSHTFNWQTHTCERDPRTGRYSCQAYDRSDTVACAFLPGCQADTVMDARFCTAYSWGCELRDIATSSLQGCYVTNPTPTPTPTPPPGETCNTVTVVADNTCGPVGTCAACTRRTGIRKSTPAGLFNCSPDICSGFDATCPGCAPPPTCTLDLPATLTIAAGSTGTITGSLNVSNGTPAGVSFASSNAAIASVNPAHPTGDATVPYQTVATGVAIGNATVTGYGYINGVPAFACSDTTAVTVSAPGPWWQTMDADILSGGDISSSIPTSCTGACLPRLILDGLGGYPGVAIYANNYSDGSGITSSKNWLAKTTYEGRVYNYSFFGSLIPSDVSLTEITDDNANCDANGCTVNAGFFNSGATPTRGYVWYHFDGDTLGDLSINSINLVGSRKVLLLIDGGNLNIDGEIRLQSPGQGFFMAMVGKRADSTRGDIMVDPSVGGNADGSPEIAGIYMADGTFSTGVDNRQLHVKGSVAAWDGFNLQRNLAGSNSNTPSELFEYDPALTFTFPRELTRDRLVWREVAP